MPITLGSNIASLMAQRRLTDSSSQLSKTFERLSSGMRINTASDDAAGLAIAEKLRVESRIMSQEVRNLNDGISLLNIADSAIENLSVIVTRLEELAEQAANGVYSSKQRNALDNEAQALSKEYLRISKTSVFNGRELLTGAFDQIHLQAGIGASSTLSVGVGGAIGTGAFATSQSIVNGADNYATVSADFNGDGLTDIAIAETINSRVSVMLGIGGGSFGPRVSYSTAGSIGLTMGDFNNDGFVDLASTDWATGQVSVLMGRGDGSFTEGGTYQVGVNARALTSADFNGDGFDDIITTDSVGDTISVLLSAGNGTFGSRVSYSTGDQPFNIRAADLNGDGVIDIISANTASNDFAVLLGRGDGTFNAFVSYAGGAASALSTLEIGDVNGDGVLDVITAEYITNRVGIYTGRGDGTFNSVVSYTVGTNPTNVTAGDFNGDGSLDVVTADLGSDSVSILINRGDGTFETRTSYTVGDSPRGVTTADINGDGVLDIISANYGTENSISILIGSTKDGVAPLLPFSLRSLADARQALSTFKMKRDQLATQRGEIGAFQSRIDIAINVLQVTNENYRAAEARIRDADVAQEAAELVRLKILQQAAAAVLAQANQQPALALKLLRSNSAP